MGSGFANTWSSGRVRRCEQRWRRMPAELHHAGGRGFDPRRRPATAGVAQRQSTRTPFRQPLVAAICMVFIVEPTKPGLMHCRSRERRGSRLRLLASRQSRRQGASDCRRPPAMERVGDRPGQRPTVALAGRMPAELHASGARGRGVRVPARPIARCDRPAGSSVAERGNEFRRNVVVRPLGKSEYRRGFDCPVGSAFPFVSLSRRLGHISHHAKHRVGFRNMSDENSQELRDTVEAIRDFYARFRRGNMQTDSCVTLCLRAAFAKSFEFCAFATACKADVPPFMYVATVRGICEDLILLKFLHSVAPALREDLLDGLIGCELRGSIECQERFFSHTRRHQPIIRNNASAPDRHREKVRTLQANWKLAGFDVKGKQVMPPTKEIAIRVGFSSLYEYIYKFSSKLVHFNPQVLLRSGWGKNIQTLDFSFLNFSRYYSTAAVTFSLLLLCLYFEHFDESFAMDGATRAAKDQLRTYVLSLPRWPELVTWEEMNQNPPDDEKWLRMAYSVLLTSLDKSVLAPDSERLTLPGGNIP